MKLAQSKNKFWSLRKTLEVLRYICDLEQPMPKMGGFDPETRKAAASALYHILRLKKGA